MFLKENFLANDSVASPPVSTVAVFIMIAIAAIGKRHLATIDVGTAYLEVESGGKNEEEVLMYIEPTVAEIMCSIEPNMRVYNDERGRIIVKLTKALYGFVKSAKLWYERLKGVLINAGFNVNPHEPCIFNKNLN